MRLPLKITLAMGLLALLSGLVLSLTVRDLLERQLRHQQIDWARTLVQSLREPLAEDVINEQQVQVESLLRRLVQANPEIEYAVLLGFDGRILAHTFAHAVPPGLLDSLTLASPQATPRFFLTPDGRRVTIVSYPLIEGLDARLQMGINDNRLQGLLTSLNIRLALIFGVAFVVLMFFVWLLSRGISRPLRTLAARLGDYGKGRDLDLRGIPDGDPDIRLLRDKLDSTLADRSRAYARLQQREQDLALTLDSIGDAVITTDRQGLVTRLNPVAAQLTGWQPEDATGKAIQSVFHVINAHTREPADNPVAKVLAQDRITALAEHTILISRSGKEYIIADSGAPIRDGSGRTIGVILVFRDISEEYRLQEELRIHRDELERLVAERTREVRQQARILEQTHDAVAVTDMDGYIINWNRGAERLYGYREDEAVGQHVSLLFRDADRERLQPDIIQPLQQRGEHEVELRLQCKDGTVREVVLSLSLIYDEQARPVAMVGYSLDITRRKQIERELKLQHAALETANAELKTFSYSVSHDLRAPLRAIDGFSQALLEDYAACLDDTGQNYLQRVRKAAQRMSQLIDDMLLLSRTTTRDLQLQKVDLSGLAETLLGELHSQDPQREVEWDIMPGLQAEADPQLLQIALTNLLDNAWKYSRDARPARIEVGARQHAGQTIFFVRDNGIGFDMAYADKLFGVFQRLHRQDEYEGTGIGLATVARIIRRHGGWIRGEAEPGAGATFSFTLQPGPDGEPPEGP